MADEILSQIINHIFDICPNGRNGLPEELFLCISALTPIPNVDLFIFNESGEILLERRNDVFYGQGWHIPGGCVRFGETMEERIQRTAIKELGSMVKIKDKNPLAIRDVLREPVEKLQNPDVRGHNITILFECALPADYEIDNGIKNENDEGYLKWFATIPKDILKVHDVYNDIFRSKNLILGENYDE